MPMMTAKIREAMSTNTELLCNSLYFGHDTLFFNSRYDSIMNFLKFENIATFLFARVERLELPANGFGDHYSAN
jgi:hypothetical protein